MDTTSSKPNKLKIIIYIIIGTILFILLIFAGVTGGLKKEEEEKTNNDNSYLIDYNSDLPIYKEIKGRGKIPDEIAQLAVGTAAKYRLLPSVIISQWAFESNWGTSVAAKADNNFFGITWFSGCPFPKGSTRGIGGSEGGNYMKFPNATQAFNYYGYMIASQKNFSSAVNEKNPSNVLLTLGRGGYAAAGITQSSPYFTNATSIISNNNLGDYDKFAISHWQELKQKKFTGNDSNPDFGNASSTAQKGLKALENKVGKTVNNGQCYGLTAYYVKVLGGPNMMNSGKSFAENIGDDYDWAKYGFKVIKNPSIHDVKAGDVVNWAAGGVLSPGIYGHTGIISSVGSDGTLHTFEQNAEKGQVCAKYSRTFNMTHINSLVRKE